MSLKTIFKAKFCLATLLSLFSMSFANAQGRENLIPDFTFKMYEKKFSAKDGKVRMLLIGTSDEIADEAKGRSFAEQLIKDNVLSEDEVEFVPYEAGLEYLHRSKLLRLSKPPAGEDLPARPLFYFFRHGGCIGRLAVSDYENLTRYIATLKLDSMPSPLDKVPFKNITFYMLYSDKFCDPEIIKKIKGWEIALPKEFPGLKVYTILQNMGLRDEATGIERPAREAIMMEKLWVYGKCVDTQIAVKLGDLVAAPTSIRFPLKAERNLPKAIAEALSRAVKGDY